VLASVLEREFKLTLRVLLNTTRDTDAPRLRQCLQTRGDVHTIAKDVIALDDHIALVNTEPELDALLRGHLGVPLNHPPLYLDSAAKRVHHAREIHEHAVPGGLDDPAPMLSDLGIYESLPVGLELGERAFFVSAHQAAVPGHVSGQDGCKPTLYPLGGRQGRAPIQGEADDSTRTGQPGRA
jgi:hypothetical protein